MTKKISIFLFLTVVAISSVSAPVSADDAAHATGPCKEIRDICKNAGFVQGEWKKGNGLWKDCIDPIIQGASSVPGATRALPSVDPSVVAACKAKHPKFGEKKMK